MIRKVVRIVTVLCALALFTGVVSAKSSSPAATKGTTAKKTKKRSTRTKKVDINSATKEQLTAVSGIDEATAQKIIAGRPFRTKRDLLYKKILTKEQYAKVKDGLIAHGGRKASAKKVSAKSK